MKRLALLSLLAACGGSPVVQPKAPSVLAKTVAPEPPANKKTETAAEPEKKATPPPPLTADIVLADWGLKDIADIGWVSFGVTGDSLVVYKVGRERPRTVVAEREPIDLRNGKFIVGRMLRTMRNRLGGRLAAFSGRGGLAQVANDPQGGVSMSYRAWKGFAGMWMRLYDERKDPEYLDIGAARYLHFAIRGKKGGEKLEIQLADKTLIAREAATTLGDVAKFLPSGRIEKEWQLASVPLYSLPDDFSRREVASIAFLASGGGDVVVRDFVLSTMQGAAPMPMGVRPPRRGLWVWRTRGVLPEDKREALIAFCMKHGVTDVFLQLPSFDESLSMVRPLIAALRKAGLRVEGLDGQPNMALKRNRRLLMRAVNAIKTYNKEVPPSERFDGLHLDIEPYLLPGFAGRRRASILRQFWVSLNYVIARAHRAGLPVTVDIPIWFDAYETSGEFVTGLAGRPLSELIIEAADAVALMDYRTDGRALVESAADELKHAESLGKAVFVGLEAAPVPDELLVQVQRDGKGQGGLVLEAARNGVVRATWHTDGAKGAVLKEAQRNTAAGRTISFATHHPAEMRGVMSEVLGQFRDWMSFAGYSFHDYAAMVKLTIR